MWEHEAPPEDVITPTGAKQTCSLLHGSVRTSFRGRFVLALFVCLGFKGRVSLAAIARSAGSNPLASVSQTLAVRPINFCSLRQGQLIPSGPSGSFHRSET